MRSLSQSQAVGTRAVMEETQRKRDMKLRSSQRVQHWGNTLEALRERKKRERARKLEEAELEQQRIDDEEARIQEEERRKVIERANRILYQDTDRAKTFHTAMLQATAIHERDRQANWKGRYEAQQKRSDALQKAANEAHDAKMLAREEREASARRRNMGKQQQMNHEALRDIHARLEAEHIEELREGERNRALAQETLREAEESERRRKERMREFNLEYVKANDDHVRLREEQKQLDALEQAKIEQWAAEKERIMSLRKASEEARKRARQEHFQQIIDRQYDSLKELKEREAARLDRELSDMNRKAEERHQAEEKQRQDSLADMLRARDNQLKRAREERERQSAQDRRMAEEWKAKNKLLSTLEKQAEGKQKQQALDLQEQLRQQAMEREAAAEYARLSEVEEARLAEEHEKREQELFEAYAREQIERFRAEGKPTLPMETALLEMRKARTQFRGK